MCEPSEHDHAKLPEQFAIAMENWRFQVGSYWTRNSYFAVFETAATAGIWRLIELKHWWTSLACSIGLVVLTIVWIFNNVRLHEYIRYWWERAGTAEEAYLKSCDRAIPLVSNYEKNRPSRNTSIAYHQSVQTIPVLFLLCWVWLGGMSLINLACNCHQLCGH